MLFLVEYADQPGSAEQRNALRDQHIAYRRSLGEALKMAGPLLLDDGQTAIGSLILLECPDRSAAESQANADPYVAASVFRLARIVAFRVAISRPFS